MPFARWQRTIVDEAGNIIPAPFIEVRREIAGAPLATLYSDRAGGSPLGNPFQVMTGDGFAAFHVAGGAFKIRAYSGGFEQIWRYVGIGTGSELDATAISGGVAYREVTAAGAVTIDVVDRIVGINKTVGAATAVTAPLAADRAELPLTIKDIKGDADTNNITITFTGGELCDGLSSILISNPYGWVTLYPRAGAYYMGP
jgi:hypothetical protein